jgi:hypothetical protein
VVPEEGLPACRLRQQSGREPSRSFRAEGETRTLTGYHPHRILSPARLPIPPLRPKTKKKDLRKKKKEKNNTVNSCQFAVNKKSFAAVSESESHNQLLYFLFLFS